MLNIVTPINHKMRQLISLDRPRTIIATSSILTLLVALIGVFLFLMPAHAASNLAPGTDPSNFVTTWNTNANNDSSTSITIPTFSGETYNYDVDWDNDGIFDQTGITGDVTHDYGVPGIHTIRVRGNFPQIFIGNLDDQNRRKIMSIDQWGAGVWTSMLMAFYGAENLTSDATDAPNLTNVTNMGSMFGNASSFNGDLSSWDTSSVTNMASMFAGASSFNNNSLSSWDTSSVTNMNGMFLYAASFNGDLSSWGTSKVTNMGSMFGNAYSFNNNSLSSWDTSSVTNMASMFGNASSFNGDLSSWDTSSVTDMSYMFSSASAFNADISGWDTGGVTNMAAMFVGASAFNADISGWNVGNVTNMLGMFSSASAFNADISGWNVGNVTNMQGMFVNASAFNYNLAAWNLASVSNMNSMLQQSGLSLTNYDATLSAWSSKQLPHDTDFNATGLKYCTASSERQAIINNFGWNFTGDSIGCEVLIDGVGSDSIVEGKAIGTTVGVLTAKDFTPRAIAPYGFSCAVPGLDDGFFTIGGPASDELKTAAVLSHASPVDAGGDNIYNICVQMRNASGDLIDTPLQVTVTPSMSVMSITPNKGRINAALTQSTITGGPFDSTVTVRFGTTQVNIDYVNQTNIYFTPPQSSVAGAVDVTVTKPGEAPVVIHDGFTYIAPEPKLISSVTFSEQSGSRLLTVHGSGMIDDVGGEYAEAFSRSLVSLNGESLKFCAFGGMTAAEMTAAYSGAYPGIGSNVTDDAPCYVLTEDGATIDMTSTQVKIRIPPTFDTTAQGTVSVNGSPVYTFNQQTTPGVDEPTAIVENKPLTGVPVIPKRPHFSGTAEPGATVTVTVHSDPISCTALADSNGNWSCQLPSDLEPGQHTVNIHIVLPGGGTQDLGPYTVTVNSDGTSTPVTNTTPLAPNTGFAQTVKTLTTQPQGLILLATLLAALGVGGMVVRERRRS